MSRKKKVIRIKDTTTAYELAAEEIAKLRKKGIPCHLEDESIGRRNYVDVMEDKEPCEPSKEEIKEH